MDDDAAFPGLETLNEAQAFSKQKIAAVRREILNSVGGVPPFGVVVCGSYGRLEASDQSDFDYFLIVEDESHRGAAEEFQTVMEDIIDTGIGKQPSSGGPFSAIELLDVMTRNLGGMDDPNDKLTRRMLFLLESRCLVNDNLYATFRDRLLERYVPDDVREENFARFLLNDLIRYYRTMCVDFEYKTREQSKPRGVRNIKLIFSRKLLYFAGVLAVARTAGLPASEKRAALRESFDKPPIARLAEECGDEARPALARYNAFLERLGNDEVRGKLECEEVQAGSDDPIYRELKDKGEKFSRELEQAINVLPDPDRIRHAMMF